MDRLDTIVMIAYFFMIDVDIMCEDDPLFFEVCAVFSHLSSCSTDLYVGMEGIVL